MAGIGVVSRRQGEVSEHNWDDIRVGDGTVELAGITVARIMEAGATRVGDGLGRRKEWE